jgi:hypothetical protein
MGDLAFAYVDLTRDPLPALGRTTITVHADDQPRRFCVHTATFTILPGGRRVCIAFIGARATFHIEMLRIVSWKLLERAAYTSPLPPAPINARIS